MNRLYKDVYTKYIQAMTSRQALAKMFMCASITHCQGKITQRALALWHLHSWHLDVSPKACNSRREIQGPKGPVLFCQSNGETIGNNSALKKLHCHKKGVRVLYYFQIIQKLPSSKIGHMSRFCESTDFWQAHPCCTGNRTLVKLIARACGLLINTLKTT